MFLLKYSLISILKSIYKEIKIFTLYRLKDRVNILKKVHSKKSFLF